MISPRLSVVVPVYNEEPVICETLRAVHEYLEGARVVHELLVVDDGSTDGTLKKVRTLTKELTSLEILASEHRGKGAAVKQGLLKARGEIVLFMDADHSTRIDEWQNFYPLIEEGCDVVIGSRKISGAHVLRHQPLLREWMGKVFTWLTNFILDVRVSDVTCGFKMFTKDAARHIFRLQLQEGWGFDSEIIFIARRAGFSIREVPVTWRDDPSTTVHLWRDALRSFLELVAIRVAAWRGKYPCGH